MVDYHLLPSLLLPYRALNGRDGRRNLDISLVMLIILVADASYLSAQARSGAASSAGVTQVSALPPLVLEDLPGAQPSLASPALDNITLAAVIAAENAGLIPPSCFTDLPLVTR